MPEVGEVEGFFDPVTNTITYVVKDPQSNHAAIIDPVLNFDPKSGRTTTDAADRVIEFVRDSGCAIDWILETHAHADHLTAAPYLQRELGGRTAIGAGIIVVQEQFKGLFNAEDGFATDGSQFDRLLNDGETFEIGSLPVTVMSTPGHTPACSTYVIGDAAFVGDTVFMPDFGTARTDFPGGDATQLYQSIQRIFSLPDQTRLFMCHDYGSPTRNAFEWQSSIAEERAKNIHINDVITEQEFVDLRQARDNVLDMPALLFPSVQVNMRGGDLPPAESNGIRYLKIPIDAV